MKTKLIYATILFVLAAAYLEAQALGTVVGTVTDQNGAVVPQATVTIINEGTQFSRTVLTNGSGQYVSESFPTGRVTVTAERPGFQKLVHSGVQLTAADTVTVNLQLAIGSVQQTVEVTGEASFVQSQTATVSTLIDNTQTMEMPLNERSFTNLLQLSAGASPSTPGMAASLTSYSMRASISISINGARANDNAYLVDGLYNRQLWNSGSMVMNPPVDAIQETRLLATDYSAQYGNAIGGVTIVLTKAGTNQIHGSAYEFLRNANTDANTFFNNQSGKPKPPYHRNEFGGTFGGPLRKDKLFIFSDYQGIRIVQPTTTVDTIPSLAQQNMVATGNFSALNAIIYNPYQTTAGSDGAIVRVPFPSNIIPRNMLDPAAVKTIGLLPIPTSSGGANNFIFNPAGTQRDDQFDVRVDENIGRSDRLFVKYSYDNAIGIGAGTLPVGPNHAGVDVNNYLAGGGPSTVANWSITGNYTKVISANSVNEFHFGLLRDFLDIKNDDANNNTATSLGIPNINISSTNTGIPYMAISGFTAIGNSNSFPEFTHQVSVPLENVLTIVKDSHTLKFGGGWARHRLDGHTGLAQRGQYAFQGAFTRQIGGTSSATALADFALGTSVSITRTQQFGAFGQRSWDGSMFAEDSWRVNNRLTVNYGLRWEFQAQPHETYNRWSNISPVTGLFAVAGTATQDVNGACGPSLVCLDRKAFAPRLGIAQQLTKDGKTVFRAGFGVSYYATNNAGRTLNLNPPMNIIQAYSYALNGLPGLRLSDGVPIPVQPNLQDPTQLNGLYESTPSELRLPRSLQFTTGIQREVLPNLLLDVGWVRTFTEHSIAAIVANQAVPGPGPYGPRRPLYSINPVLGDIDYRSPNGMSKYNSLQVKVNKRYSRGLTGGLAWTWSHNMTDGNGGTRPQNSLCLQCEWGNVPEDRRHMVVINHVYELPFGHGRQFVNSGWISNVIGDWQISGIWTMYTGLHVTPALASSVSNSLPAGVTNTIAPVERPNLNGNPNLPVDQRTITHWFNVAAFSSPALYTWGNAGNGIIVGPGYFNLDVGIHRTFPIRERIKLTFRGEMFNALNHTNFQNPNATIGSSSAGVINATYPSRIMQGALRLSF